MALVMKNPRKTIYTRLREAVKPLCTNTTTTSSFASAVFPCFSVSMLGMPTDGSDLSGDEAAVSVSIQCDSYMSGVGALDYAYDIDTLSHEEMVSMGFRRTFGPQEMENGDAGIKRVTSRYSRLLGSGDEL